VNPAGIQFWGQSFVAAPSGEVVTRASVARPEAIVADCNLDLVEVARTHWPFLRDRRIDAYGGLTQRYGD
jgi:N-carbamoylputrescine amidase